MPGIAKNSEVPGIKLFYHEVQIILIWGKFHICLPIIPDNFNVFI